MAPGEGAGILLSIPFRIQECPKALGWIYVDRELSIPFRIQERKHYGRLTAEEINFQFLLGFKC